MADDIPDRSNFFKLIKMEIKKLEITSDLLEYKGRKIAVILEDYRYDEGTLRVIGEKKAPVILIPVELLLTTKGMSRAKLISKLRNFLQLCAKFGVNYALGIIDKNTKRDEKEIISVGVLLGLNEGQAKMAVKRFSDLFSQTS